MARKPTRARALGVTDADYFRMLGEQAGQCAIVGCERTPKTRRFHADHDHATMQNRGLLCHWHNRILPRKGIEALAMAAYLAGYEDETEYGLRALVNGREVNVSLRAAVYVREP